MKMVSSSVMGIVLAVAMFATGIATDRLLNVYVTNFPLDEQGNLRTTGSKAAFPSTLILRGIGLRTEVSMNITTGTWEYAEVPLLIDQNTPYPPSTDNAYTGYTHGGTSEWIRVYDQTFVYHTSSLRNYYIQGQVVAGLKVGYSIYSWGGGSVHINITYCFEKIDAFRNVTTLASKNVALNRQMQAGYTWSADHSSGFVFPFESPSLIQEGEKLAVRLFADVQSYGSDVTFYHYLGAPDQGNAYPNVDFEETKNLWFVLFVPVIS